MLAHVDNTDPERPAPGASLGELIYLENNGGAIASISDDLRRDPSTSDGLHVRDVGFRDMRCRPSTSTSTTRTSFNALDDMHKPSFSCPPHAFVDGYAPPETLSSHPRLSICRVKESLVVVQASIPLAHHRLRPRKRMQDRCEDRSQRQLYGPPHVDVVPRPPALRHQRARADLQRSEAHSTPFSLPPVVTNHAAAIITLNGDLLDDASDASDVAYLDSLNAPDSPLSPCYRAHPTSVTSASPLDDVADAFDVALLDALIDTLALCVAALIARRRTSETASQDVVDELGERLPSSGTAHLAFESGLLVCRGHAANARGYHRSTTVKIHTSTSPLSPASSKGEERRWREGEGRQ
ncbi:hypothetical protein EV715DRAFT_298151 [Schizophyllum commune]